MKVTPQMRLDAILICDIAASGHGDTMPIPYYDIIAADLGLDEQAREQARGLAIAVWNRVWHESLYRAWTPAVDAEAAQLLREGWTP